MSLRHHPVVKRVVIWIVVLVLLAVSAFFLYQQYKIDRCLDGGGSWDYERSLCEY